MKLSEILKDWPEKKFEEHNDETGESCGCESLSEYYPCEIKKIGFNTALTSCDREIDREALAKVLYGLKSFFKNPHHYSLKEQAKMSEDDVEKIISTMPTWLKPTERK